MTLTDEEVKQINEYFNLHCEQTEKVLERYEMDIDTNEEIEYTSFDEIKTLKSVFIDHKKKRKFKTKAKFMRHVKKVLGIAQ